jgi:ATP-dependent DNA helicase RecG
MRSLTEVQQLLDELETTPADTLEAQDLDFKEWSLRSLADAVDLAVEMAICMANGGGGTVIFGINDKRVGRAQAILGVPPEVDINRLKKAIYDRTDPKLTPVVEDIRVPEGTGRLLVMQVHPGLPPYTDSSGAGKIRIGTDCQPLTGTLRRRIMVETGETDFTAVEVPGDPTSHLSAAAMERLRDVARRERAPSDLLQLSDIELLGALQVLRDGRLTRAGLLLAGSESALETHIPGHVWTHFRMRSDTEYSDPLHGRAAIPIALARLEERIDNPVETLPEGMYHFEYRTFPEIALREALMNALCHRDYRITGPVLLKQYPNHLDIHSPGGFIGGVSPSNLLHHQPVARNPHLVEALIRLRLVNRGNLGIRRMFGALLREGKEPPRIVEAGDAVTVSFPVSAFSTTFRTFVSDEEAQGHILTVDQLLVLHHLLHYPEIDVEAAARLCQLSEANAHSLLNEMGLHLGYLERGATTTRPTGHCGQKSIAVWLLPVTSSATAALIGRPPKHAF